MFTMNIKNSSRPQKTTGTMTLTSFRHFHAQQFYDHQKFSASAFPGKKLGTLFVALSRKEEKCKVLQKIFQFLFPAEPIV